MSWASDNSTSLQVATPSSPAPIMIRQIPLRPVASTTVRLLSTPLSRPPFALPTSARCQLSTETIASTTQAPPTPPAAAASTPFPNATRPRSSPKGASRSKPTRVSAQKAPKPLRLTYLVERTVSKNLPVYEDAKSGGTRKFTQIRKVVGNGQHLKRDIIQELGFKKDDVSVNPVTLHVIVKVSNAWF